MELELWEAPGRRGSGRGRAGPDPGALQAGRGTARTQGEGFDSARHAPSGAGGQSVRPGGAAPGTRGERRASGWAGGAGPPVPTAARSQAAGRQPSWTPAAACPHLGTGKEVLPGAESHGRCLHAMRKPRLLTLRLSRCVDWEPRAVAAGLSPRVASEACLFALERTRDQGPRAAASERPPAFLQDAGGSTEPCSVDIALRCRSPARCPLAPRNSCAHLRCAVGEVAAVASQRVCPSCRFSAPSRHQA